MSICDPILVSDFRKGKVIVRIFRMPLPVAGIQLARLREEPPFNDTESNESYEQALRIAICAGSRFEQMSSILVMFRIVESEKDPLQQSLEFSISPIIDHIADAILPYPQEEQQAKDGVCLSPDVIFKAFDSLPPPSETEKENRGN